MSRAGVRTAGVLGTALLLGAGPATGAVGDPCPASDGELEAVRAVLTRWIEHRRALAGPPGLSIGLVCGEEVVWTRGFGVADVERGTPVAADTRFRIASVTKLFTATAVLRLRDVGALALSDPVSDHLPWFRLGGKGGTVTIGDLLSHTGGLPANSAATDFTTMTQPSVDRAIAALGSQTLVYPPGTRFKYSNLGFAILGRVVAAASGTPYDEYVRETILAPLAMDDTRVRPERGDPGATGYGPRRPGRPRRVAEFLDLAFATPAGGMSSTAEDLAEFLAFQIDPASRPGVLDPATVREMHQIRFAVDPGGAGSGLGWAVDRRDDRHVVYHGGALPSQTSHVQVDLGDGVGAVALTNAEDGRPDVWAGQATALLRLAVNDAFDETPAEGWSRYAGRFCWRDRERWTVVLGGRLLLVDPLADRPADSAVDLRSLGGSAFRPAGGRVVGETVRIVVGADGGAEALVLPDLRYGECP